MYIEDYKGFEIHFEALPEFEEGFDEGIPHTVNLGDEAYFCAAVSARKGDIELATAYLGNCVYNSEEEFYTTYKDDYYADLREEAVKEAREKLSLLCES